jgi:hypothetical protein
MHSPGGLHLTNFSIHEFPSRVAVAELPEILGGETDLGRHAEVLQS